MKKKAGGIVKQIIGVLESKARALKMRLIIFWLLKDKKVLLGSNITPKAHSLTLSHRRHHHHHPLIGVEESAEEERKLEVVATSSLHNNIANIPVQTTNQMVDHEKETTAAVEEEEDVSWHNNWEFEYWDDKKIGMGGSVIEVARKCKEGEGEEFRLEEEIDQVADLFIRRFRHQLRVEAEDAPPP